MNENIYRLFEDILVSDFHFHEEGIKKTLVFGKDGEHGKMETYSIFPGVILAFIDLNLKRMDEIFVEENLDARMLEINHCAGGRYAYGVGGDKIIYFEKGDLCVCISEIMKTVSDFPLGYYRGIELFMDIDVANGHIKEFIPDFDLIEFYEDLKKNRGYVLVRANEKIDHVIGELYNVDERIKESYFKLKCVELLLFFSITEFKEDNKLHLSRNQVLLMNDVRNDLISNMDSRITIDEMASKYGMSKTTLKNCFKEVYGKPIYKWIKEYKLDYACELIEEGNLTISEISKMVGYSSPSKFTQAFKEYVGCKPSEYAK